MSDSHPIAPAKALYHSLPDSHGTHHLIGDYLVKGPVLLTIYKSSCAASKAMLPLLGRIDAHHHVAGLTTLAISQDSANITRSFARRYEITYPQLIEGSTYPISSAFEIRATPSIYFIRTDGAVTYGTMGFMRDQIQEIEEAVAAELNVPPVTIVRDDEADIPWFVPG